MPQFHKYEGLGNDYLVLDPAGWALPLTPERIRRLCDRHFGLGSDGILWGPEAVPDKPDAVRLRIFNPDGRAGTACAFSHASCGTASAWVKSRSWSALWAGTSSAACWTVAGWCGSPWGASASAVPTSR